MNIWTSLPCEKFYMEELITNDTAEVAVRDYEYFIGPIVYY